jgi:hypothetical protein
VVTNLVVEETIPDIFHHFRHSQNIVLRLLITLDADVIVENVPFISDRPESAARELVQPWVGVSFDHSLEQNYPSLMLMLVLHHITIVLS